MLVSGTLVVAYDISFIVAISVTKLSSHSTNERTDSVSHDTHKFA
jgi:hypothetical protein